MASQNEGEMEPVQNILLPIFPVSLLVQTGDSPAVEVMTPPDCQDLTSFVFDSNTLLSLIGAGIRKNLFLYQ